MVLSMQMPQWGYPGFILLINIIYTICDKCDLTTNTSPIDAFIPMIFYGNKAWIGSYFRSLFLAVFIHAGKMTPGNVSASF